MFTHSTPQQQPKSSSTVPSFVIAAIGCVFGLSALIYSSSFAISKWNDGERQRLTRNNLQLVKDNQQLRKDNEKLRQQLTQTSDRLQQIDDALMGLGYRRLGYRR